MAKKLLRITIDIEAKYDNYLEKIKKLIQEHMKKNEGKDIGLYLCDVANYVFSSNASYEVLEERPEEKEIVEYSQGWYEQEWGDAFVGLENALMDKLILHVDKNKDKYVPHTPDLPEKEKKELEEVVEWWYKHREEQMKEIGKEVDEAYNQSLGFITLEI